MSSMCSDLVTYEAHPVNAWFDAIASKTGAVNSCRQAMQLRLPLPSPSPGMAPHKHEVPHELRE